LQNQQIRRKAVSFTVDICSEHRNSLAFNVMSSSPNQKTESL